MKRKIMNLAEYKACICEGGAERAIMDILLENDLLIFSKKDLLEEKVLSCRGADAFQKQCLRKSFNGKISVIRVLDRRNENFKLSKAYQDKVNVVNIVTAPEIEMLIIHSEGKYEEYKRSGKKPCDFCKQNLPELGYRKRYDDIKRYFDSSDKLVKAIKTYHQKQQDKGEWSLLDLLKDK